MKNVISIILVVLAVIMLTIPVHADPEGAPGGSDGLCHWLNQSGTWVCVPNYTINCNANGGYCRVRKEDDYCYCFGTP